MSIDAVAGKPKTGGYKCLPVHAWGYQHRDLPLFTFLTIRAMLMDPTVRLGLAMRAAPIYAAEAAYKEGDNWVAGCKCENPQVKAWVDRTFDRIWSNDLEHILAAQIWGWSAGEVLWDLKNGRLEFDRILPRHSRDVAALTRGSELAGVRFRRVDGGDVDLTFPKCFFHGINQEPGSFYGRSVTYGSYSPWADKAFAGGAVDVRKLFMHKDAYGGMTLWYPDETYDIDGVDTPSRDIAREWAEQVKAGGVGTLPSTRDENGHRKWEIERAHIPSNPQHILQYPKDLDVEILRGMEIPDDVITSEATGAWAGKKVPMKAFYTGLNCWANAIVRDIQKQLLEPGVRMNFGAVDFEVRLKPINVQMAEDEQPQAASGPDPMGEMGAAKMSTAATVGRGDIEAAKIVRAIRLSGKRPNEKGDLRKNDHGTLLRWNGRAWETAETGVRKNSPGAFKQIDRSPLEIVHGISREEIGERLAGPELTREITVDDLPSLIGAPLIAKVEISLAGQYGVQVVAQVMKNNTPLFSQNVTVDAKSERLYIRSFELDESQQKRGIGTEVFAEMVQASASVGFKDINCAAIGEYGQRNGYYSWPRMGFNARLSDDEIGQVKSELGKDVEFLSDLMLFKNGRDWWLENGKSIEVQFDLDPESLSRKYLEIYIAQKTLKGFKMSLNANSEQQPESNLGDVFPLEDKLADSIWDSLGPEWAERARESMERMEKRNEQIRRQRQGDGDD